MYGVFFVYIVANVFYYLDKGSISFQNNIEQNSLYFLFF